MCNPVQMCCHTNILSCSLLPARVVIMAGGAVLLRWAPRESPLASHSRTHGCAGAIPCHSRHSALRARNGRHVSLSAPTLSGCNFSPLEESHTCFTLHPQNRRNKALSAEILLKHAIGRPGDFISQLNKDRYTFILEHLFVITALLNLFDSKLQKCYSKQMTEMLIVN